MIRKMALYAASLLALVTAIYHGVLGDSMMRALPLETNDMALVRATFQIGTMGWLMGGFILLGAGRIQSQQARNWIVYPLSLLYGFPAVGNFMLNKGKPSFGWIALMLIAGLTLFGRKITVPQEA